MRNRLVTSAQTGSVENYLLPQRRADGSRPVFGVVIEEDLREVTVDPNIEIVDEDAVAEIAQRVAKKEAQHADYVRIINLMNECPQEEKERHVRVDHKRMKEQCAGIQATKEQIRYNMTLVNHRHHRALTEHRVRQEVCASLFALHLEPVPLQLVKAELEALQFRHAFHTLEVRYRNPIQDSQEAGGLWSILFGLFYDPRTHTLPDLLNSTRDICWILADFGVPNVESDEFLRGHILRILLQCTDFDIVRICHWVEHKNENLAQLSYRATMATNHLDLKWP